MINDSSISEIIKSLKISHQNKLNQDQLEMKDKILSQFKKLSKEENLNQAIKEIYSVILFHKPDYPTFEVTGVPLFEKQLGEYLSERLKLFYKEISIIGEDGFNLMTYVEYLLNAYDEDRLFWCSYPQISYDMIEEADTYYFTLIEFDSDIYKHNLYFENKIHPFIKSLNFTWSSHYKERSYDNAFREAASGMNDLLSGIWDHVNILSTLKYEGIRNNGSILFMDDQQPTILLSFEQPVALSNYRQIRKLLQMSRYQHYLLINQQYMAIGFGYIEKDDSIYRIDFLDHLSWKMYKGSVEFLSCSNLLPVLPNVGNNVTKLKQQLACTFEFHKYNQNLIVEIIEEAKYQRKGTMIVVCENAKEEAERLQTSSIKIKPIQFTRNQIKMVTGIDGAIIMDLDGYCHAIGSILDGLATDTGDPSRGARYNSALRYLNTQKNNNNACLIAVVSEDRYVDIISTYSHL